MAENVTEDAPFDELLVLKEHLTPIAPDDPMPEAARKVLLADFIQMLEYEAGSRAGTDMENVHKMRVATRKMRSTLWEMRDYFDPKSTKKFEKGLKMVARTLGDVRDLDVMIKNLVEFRATQETEEVDHLKSVLGEIDQERTTARNTLISLLDSKRFQKFVDQQQKVLISSSKDVKAHSDQPVVPIQVRHVLPVLIQERLSQIKAYDVVIGDASFEQLHGLRIEFKRLRYIVSGFESVLGSTAEKFIVELKQIQDHLGELNDAKVAIWSLRPRMKELSKDDPARDALKAYINQNKEKVEQLIAGFPPVWERFNSRTVQRALSDALLVLR